MKEPRVKSLINLQNILKTVGVHLQIDSITNLKSSIDDCIVKKTFGKQSLV